MSSESPAIAAPSASEPTSPMNTCAGAAFHHRKPRQAPIIAAATMARSSAPAGSTWYTPGWRNCQNAMITNAAKTIAAEPAARPSSAVGEVHRVGEAVDPEDGEHEPQRGGEVEVEHARERQVRRHVHVVEGEQREADGDEQLTAGLAPLAQPHVATAPHAEVVVDEADDRHADDQRHQGDAGAGELRLLGADVRDQVAEQRARRRWRCHPSWACPPSSRAGARTGRRRGSAGRCPSPSARGSARACRRCRARTRRRCRRGARSRAPPRRLSRRLHRAAPWRRARARRRGCPSRARRHRGARSR